MLSAVAFSIVLKGSKIMITLPKICKDSKFLQNILPISLLSTTGKLFEKVIVEMVKRHSEERNLKIRLSFVQVTARRFNA
jgi:hypothetical protein